MTGLGTTLNLMPLLSYQEGHDRYYSFHERHWAWFWQHAIRKDGLLEWDSVIESTESKWTQPETVAAVQWIGQDLRENGWMPTPEVMAGGAISFWAGQVAMEVDGPWYLPYVTGEVALKEGGLNYMAAGEYASDRPNPRRNRVWPWLMSHP